MLKLNHKSVKCRTTTFNLNMNFGNFMKTTKVRTPWEQRAGKSAVGSMPRNSNPSLTRLAGETFVVDQFVCELFNLCAVKY